MSLGGLMVGVQPVSSAIVAATSFASARVNFGESRKLTAGRSRTENHNPRYGADSQRRPYCPRPFVCRSANATKPFRAPRSSACQTKSLVDSVSSTTTIWFSSAARSSVAIRRSLTFDMRQLKREIDPTGGMGERADGNVIDSARGDPPHILQVDPATRLEFHLPLSRRDRLAHFGRLHVIEQDYVDPFHVQERADLIEPVRFDFNANTGAFLPQSLDDRGDPGRFRSAEVIVFYEHHVAQGVAMVRAAASQDCRFFQAAQTRRRLSRIENFRARFADTFDELASERCNAAQALAKIQRHAFRRQNRARRSAHLHDCLAAGERGSIRLKNLDAQVRIDPPKNLGRHFRSRDDSPFSCHDSAEGL